MPITNTQAGRPHISAQLVFRPQGEQVLVYNAATDQMYLLWPRAAEILKRCDGTRTTTELAADAFPDEPRLSPRRDALVARLLGEFERRRLVTWQGDD